MLFSDMTKYFARKSTKKVHFLAKNALFKAKTMFL